MDWRLRAKPGSKLGPSLMKTHNFNEPAQTSGRQPVAALIHACCRIERRMGKNCITKQPEQNDLPWRRVDVCTPISVSRPPVPTHQPLPPLSVDVVPKQSPGVVRLADERLPVLRQDSPTEVKCVGVASNAFDSRTLSEYCA